MLEAAKIVHAIQNTSGTNAKKAILLKNRNNQELKEILKFIYNPYLKTGISASKLAKILHMTDNYKQANASYIEMDYKKAIEYFSTHTTGADADLVVAARFINSTIVNYNSQSAFELAKALVTQNLKMGVAVKTLNEVFGKDFIPVVGCMLGYNFGDVGANKVAWPCIVTEKLDGIRRVLVKENGVCKFYSRSGHEDIGLIEILSEVDYLPDNTVYDGELLAAGIFKNSIAQRQATNSIASTDGPKRGLIFNIFDMLPVDEFYRGVSSHTALVRKATLGATLMDPNISLLPLKQPGHTLIAAFGIHCELQFIKSVPILGHIYDLSDIEPVVNHIWKNGGEGVMLNPANALYEVKRTKNLLKVKHTESMTLNVIDFVEGTDKYEGMLGSLIVEYKGERVGVGSGLTDNQRRDIWDNPEKYIGRKIEIDTFGESTNKLGTVSLNCPIFKRFAKDVE